MKWEIANSGGIEVDPTSNSWHAGRIVDMLKIRKDRILVATPNSGVWIIHLGFETAIPLSLDWDNPNVTCLAFGPDTALGHHIFAGCGYWSDNRYGGGLYESDMVDPLSPSDPIYKPWRKIPLDPKIGSITDITILPNKRVIVLACWGGIAWAFIPDPGGTYEWQMAEWSGGSGDDVPGFGNSPPPCFSVTLGQGNTVVAGAWATEPKKRGIFTGNFIDRGGLSPTGRLIMHTTTIHDWAPYNFKGQPVQTAMDRVSVASCPSQPKFVYALITQPHTEPNEFEPEGVTAGHVIMVLRSQDGGLNWNKCGLMIPGAPSGDFAEFSVTEYGDNGSGGELHAISVSPHNPDHVAFGILCPFISFDRGMNWQPLRPWSGAKPEIDHYHSDIHFIYFDPDWPDQLFIGSDGGIISTTDKGSSFRSGYNKNLYNLLFYSTCIRQFYGTFGASPWFPNIIAGGLHDNGNVYCALGEQGVRTPWKRLDYGDGGQVVFTNIEDLVLHAQEAHFNDTTERSATFDTPEYKLVENGYIPVRSREGLELSRSIPWAIMDKIFDPIFKNDGGQLMYAMAAANPIKPYTQAVPGTDLRIFGLFANPDGKDIHWEPISDNNWSLHSGAGSGSGSGGRWLYEDYITAVGSRDGNLVFISQGMNIFTLTPLDGKVVSTFYVGGFGSVSGVISRFAIESDKLAYATYNTEDGQGYLIRTRNSGATWEKVTTFPLGGGSLFGLEYDDNTIPKTLYVATDTRVAVSTDEGISWYNFSDGLPACPHCADLRFVRHSGGARYLYLSTWGWSVWQVKLG